MAFAYLLPIDFFILDIQMTGIQLEALTPVNTRWGPGL